MPGVLLRQGPPVLYVSNKLAGGAMTVVAGLFIAGALLGAAIRLPLFLLVLAAAAFLAGLSAAPQGLVAALRDGAIAAIALQLGYAAGIIMRAVVGNLRHRWAASRRAGQHRNSTTD